MRKLALLAMALLLGLSLAACAKDDPNAGEPNGEVGKTYETKWFTFSVDAMEKTQIYKGIEAAEGSTYLVCTVTETNNWEEKEALPMSAEDFYVNREGWEGPVGPETAWDEAMMPLSFDLAHEETVTYDVVFAVPTDTADVQFVYVEVNENQEEFATFTINHAL
jgi:hypothetical protein